MTEILRAAIRDSGLSAYRISKDTGLWVTSIIRFVEGETSLRLTRPTGSPNTWGWNYQTEGEVKMETDSSPTAEQNQPKLRWYQWRLRSLFFLTFLVAIGMSWLAVTIQNQRKQKAAASNREGGRKGRVRTDMVGETLAG